MDNPNASGKKHFGFYPENLPISVMDQPRKIRVIADFALKRKFDFRKT